MFELLSLGKDPHLWFQNFPILLLTATISPSPLCVLKAVIFLYQLAEELDLCVKVAKDSAKKSQLWPFFATYMKI